MDLKKMAKKKLNTKRLCLAFSYVWVWKARRPSVLVWVGGGFCWVVFGWVGFLGWVGGGGGIGRSRMPRDLRILVQITGTRA